MPLIFQKTIENHMELYLWEVSESLLELSNIHLSKASKMKLKKLQNIQDKKNFLALRHLLLKKGYRDNSLKYQKNGKPYLSDKNYLSISHSFDKVALVFSKFPVGLDVEKKREKLLRVKEKFLKKEYTFLTSKKELEQLLVIWCAKESLYKLYGMAGVSLKEHMEVLPFSFKDSFVFVDFIHLRISQKHKVFFGFIDNFCWAVCML